MVLLVLLLIGSFLIALFLNGTFGTITYWHSFLLALFLNGTFSTFIYWHSFLLALFPPNIASSKYKALDPLCFS